MVLNLYRRHRSNCAAGRTLHEMTYESDELRREMRAGDNPRIKERSPFSDDELKRMFEACETQCAANVRLLGPETCTIPAAPGEPDYPVLWVTDSRRAAAFGQTVPFGVYATPANLIPLRHPRSTA